MKLSIVIPIYNEQATLEQILERVLATPFDKEVLLVDDGSGDASREIMARYEDQYPEVRCFYHRQNKGKGAALATGFQEVQGDLVVIQDADLEYNPEDYGILIEPIASGLADVVYGSRFLGRSERVHYRLHTFANRVITYWSNLFTGYSLTDVETCYKVFPVPLARSLKLTSHGFTVEPEMTAAFSRRKLRIVEVPIRYQNRSYEDGKKVGWKDGFEAIWAIVRYRFRQD